MGKLVEISFGILGLVSLFSYFRTKDLGDRILAIVALSLSCLGISGIVFSQYLYPGTELSRILVTIFKFATPLALLIVCEEGVSIAEGKEKKKELFWSLTFFFLVLAGGILTFIYKPVLVNVENDKLVKFIGTSRLSITPGDVIMAVSFLSALTSLIPPVIRRIFWGLPSLTGFLIIMGVGYGYISSQWSGAVIHILGINFSYQSFLIIGLSVLVAIKGILKGPIWFMSLRHQPHPEKEDEKDKKLKSYIKPKRKKA